MKIKENEADAAPNAARIEALKESASQAPSVPGVYIMKDEGGEIIYIGKAKSLKNRLKSYFTGEKDIKTATLMKRVRSIETIIVPAEYDALLLENTLIKQHSPRYNINLKDGKTYAVIRVTNEKFPRVFRTRKIVNDSSAYYGPFPNTQAVIAMMAVIDKIFPLRKCKNLKKRKAPCMYYHIGRCMAPCSGKIGAETYRIHAARVQKLLEGDIESLIIDLTEKMHEEAKALNFEKAAFLRNAIASIEELTSGNNSVEDMNPEDRDYIAWASSGVLLTFTVFSMRGGKMTGRDLFRTQSAGDETEGLESFLTAYYNVTRQPPCKIYLQGSGIRDQGLRILSDKKSTIKQVIVSNSNHRSPIPDPHSPLIYWLKNNFDYIPEFLQPQDKRHCAIMNMAKQNAEEDIRKRVKERGAGPALDELARALNLKSRPERIEGFDISHLDGKFPVASLVSFINGVPDKKNYRHYKLRTLAGKIDDFASMREVIKRRYSRLLREGEELPDLILVDGGLGQANAAKGVLDELGAEIDLAGLAKENEEIWLPYAKKPIILSKQSEALKVLQQARDESHRFANNFNRKLRSKEISSG